MRIQITYIAEDGEEFETLKECHEWERKINSLPSTIAFKNEEGILLCPHGAEEINKAYNCAQYICVSQGETWKEDLNFLRWYWGFCLDSIDGIDGPGTYSYNKENMNWEKVKNE